MTSQEMMKTPAKSGYWFVNVSSLGETPNWVLQVIPQETSFLFGYNPQDLLNKQYR